MAQRFIFYFSFLIIPISCNNYEVDISESIISKEFYLVLNDLVQNELKDDTIILCRTKPIYKNKYGSWDISLVEPEHLPPPGPGIISFDRIMFNSLVNQNMLDSNDAEYMYQSIDSTIIMYIDSTKVNFSVVSKSISEKFFKPGEYYKGFKEIEKIYTLPHFIISSMPVFNKDYTKAIIAIDFHHSMVFGFGRIYLLEKVNGKWMTKSMVGTWRQ